MEIGNKYYRQSKKILRDCEEQIRQSDFATKRKIDNIKGDCFRYIFAEVSDIANSKAEAKRKRKRKRIKRTIRFIILAAIIVILIIKRNF